MGSVRAIGSRRGVALALAVAATCGAGAPAPPAEHSVVRIVNYAQRGNWFAPWEVSAVRETAGSGFVIAGGLVLTNAHVVSDSRLLVLTVGDDPVSWPAEVVHVAHDCDLALVRPKEAAALAGVAPLELLEGLPALGSEVDTLGFPAGGIRVSSTRGVVSRLEAQLYAHSGIDRHVTIQTDAAINPGNSGGPVIQGGRVVGVAFQVAADLENVGYAIPTEVIQRFLRDVEDGRYDGYPELGDSTSNLESATARRRAGMADGESGVRVDAIYPGSSAEGHLSVGDVLLAVEGRPIANDGSVADGGERLPFGLLVDRRQVGESVVLRVLRDRERLDVTVPLRGLPAVLTLAQAYDRLPRYFVYGGLVFVPLELESLATYGDDWRSRADTLLLDALYLEPLRRREPLRRERVLLLRRLDHPVNSHIAWFRYQIVDRVNGRPVNGLEDLVEAVESCRDDFQVFEMAHFRRLCVLDRRAVEAANPEILERYEVPADRRLR